MARIFPSDLPPVRQEGGRWRELEVLERLQLSLSPNYSVFHNVPWLRPGNLETHGQIDIVVVNGVGDLLLIEVKAGELIEREQGLFKLYSDGEKSVSRQSLVQGQAIYNRLNQAGLKSRVHHCLVLPDYLIKNGDGIALPRTHIVDASSFGTLGSQVTAFLPDHPASESQRPVIAFLCNLFELKADVTALADRLESTTQQLADGLAT